MSSRAPAPGCRFARCSLPFADATAIGASGARNRFTGRFVGTAFRELLVFLLLRLLAATEQDDGWLAHSVDPVDLPAFFADYVGPALPAWLESLSQASNGEYARPPPPRLPHIPASCPRRWPATG